LFKPLYHYAHLTTSEFDKGTEKRAMNYLLSRLGVASVSFIVKCSSLLSTKTSYLDTLSTFSETKFGSII